jgi:hypothetical protein
MYYRLGRYSPLAKIGLEVDDGLGALDVAKTPAPTMKHLICCLWEQATDVDIGLAGLVLKAAVKRLVW